MAKATGSLMTQPSNPPVPQPLGEEANDARLSALEDLASTFRRLEGNEDFDANGVRTVWHRGKGTLELLSWENDKKVVIKQELTFLDMTIEMRREQPFVKTGRLRATEDRTHPGKKGTPMVQLDQVPQSLTLQYAAHLLRHAPGRDYYAQYLLKHVVSTMTALSSDSEHTVVSTKLFSRGDVGQKTHDKLFNDFAVKDTPEPAPARTGVYVRRALLGLFWLTVAAGLAFVGWLMT